MFGVIATVSRLCMLVPYTPVILVILNPKRETDRRQEE